MSFSLTVPRSETYDDFVDAVDAAEESPKADRRTSGGKRQKVFVERGKNALIDLAGSFDGPLSGTISGHVNPELSGNINVSLALLNP